MLHKLFIMYKLYIPELSILSSAVLCILALIGAFGEAISEQFTVSEMLAILFSFLVLSCIMLLFTGNEKHVTFVQMCVINRLLTTAICVFMYREQTSVFHFDSLYTIMIILFGPFEIFMFISLPKNQVIKNKK
jgi:hypothetical protein